MKLMIRNFILMVGLLLSSTAWSASTIQPKIIGGIESLEGEWPWMTALSFDSSSALTAACGASLIDQQWLLTAAHCMFNTAGQVINASQLTAFVGAYDLANSPGLTRYAAEIIVHPEYNALTSENDIALIKLSSPVTTITPLAYINSTNVTDLQVNDSVTVIGWGNTSTTTNSFPNVLRDVTVPYVDTSVCNVGLGGQVTENMMCAGLSQGGKDSCQGDSGGPLVFYSATASAWVQAGVVSWGDGCAEAGKYGVYSRVSQYEQWIRLTLQGIKVSTRIDFGSWLPNLVATASLEIENTGTDFALSTITLDSSGGVFVYESNTCDTTVFNGETCQINFSFSGSALGQYDGAVTLSTDLAVTDLVIPLHAKVITETIFSNFFDADSSISWAIAGDSNWSPVQVTNDGGNSLQSGNVDSNQYSSLFAYFSLASSLQTVYFDWRACSEPNFDFLELWVNNQKVDAISGNADWRRASVQLVGVGDHVIEWRYNKDYLYSFDSDAGWLDNIYFDASSPLPVQNRACNLGINDVPTENTSAGAFSPWFAVGLFVPLLFRRRFDSKI